MEWLVLALLAALAAAPIATPLRRGGGAPAPDGAAGLEALAAERRTLLAELRELDDDAAAGRISAADRLAGRRALAPRLRAAVEALRAAGAGPRGEA